MGNLRKALRGLPGVIFVIGLWQPLPVLAQGQAPSLDELEARLESTSGRERLSLLVALQEQAIYRQDARALEWGREALELLETYPDGVHAMVLARQAIGHESEGDFEASARYAVEAVELARRLDDQPALAFALNRHALASLRRAEYEAAIAAAQEACSIYRVLDDPGGCGSASSVLATSYYHLGQPTKSMEMRLQGLRYFEQAGDQKNVKRLLFNIAVLYFFEDKLEEALEFATKVRDSARESGDELMYSLVVQLVGNIHREKGEPAKALDLLGEALEIQQRLGGEAVVAETLQNLSDTYLDLGRPGPALEYARRSLALYEAADAADEVAVDLLLIGRAHNLLGAYSEALGPLRRSLEIGEDTESQSRRSEALGELSKALAGLGRHEQALDAFHRHAQLEREIFTRENDKAMNEMRTRLEVDLKEQEIEQLERQRRLDELELRAQRQLRWGLSIGFVLVVAVLLLLFNRYRLQSRQALMAETVRREREVSARLREVDKLKDEFLANTSHELRTPLNGITGLAESLVAGAAGEVSEAMRSNLSMIVTSGRRLGHLVGDILDFSKLRHKSLELDLRPVDLRPLVEVVLTLSRPLVDSKKTHPPRLDSPERPLRLENSVPADLPAVSADESRLQQILHNLVGNAIKFTDSGSIEVSAAVEGDRIAVRVRDTGIGIAPGQQQRIFDAFEQADASIERRHGGTGLGLAVTRQLVELHGGEIHLESTLGEGSVFSFSLPIADAAAETDRTQAAPSRPAVDVPVAAAHETPPVLPAVGADADGARILVVDDDPINRQVLRNYLAVERFDLTLAPGGEEALRLLGEQNFDLVLLDVMMPGLSGYEVCRALRREHPLEKLPVIFLTAKDQDSDVVTGMALGANDYLTKPISKDRLLARVRPHLDLLHVHRNLESLVAEKMSQIKVLKGLLPICAGCKKIRDDEGTWDPLEVFIDRHSEAEFSHGLCPDCVDRAFAELPELRPPELT